MTGEEYASERKKRGTQKEVAALLDVRQATISERERSDKVTREAELALLSLPIKKDSLR
jgi:DNA-binding transcriptional regulator YiaG